MEKTRRETTVKAATRVSISLVIGLIAATAIGTLTGWKYAPLTLWDSAALVFLLWLLISLHGRNAMETKRLATREDPGRAGADILLVLASVASLIAVGTLLWQTKHETGLAAVLQPVLCVISVVISWTTVHTVYMLRYAREYYQSDGGIDFNDKNKPRYSDFAYLAFTVGMTFQVSDTEIQTNVIRRLILHQALLSYLFGTVIVAVSINVLAGLVN
ncbi:MAG TPA: DUF1345 domain-containing protein [Pyrinomonadaceae bacterium]